ncbi:MAG: 4-hydroxy-tetrahydrodipicolinate reductase [Marinicellaceae bacterium]
MNLKIGIAGISGRIGQELVDLIENDLTLTIQCGLVSKDSHYTSQSISVSHDCKDSDIWIDFSTPNAFEKVLKHCIKSKTPLVSGTTGLSKKHFKEIENAATKIPVIWTSNFAISVNLIQQLLSSYSQLKDSKVNITETHHIHKVDKPSGTAISLARSIKPHGILKSTDENEFLIDDITIQSIRDAEIAGIHQVSLDNQSETIEITHSAKTPRIFAQGAISVAHWLMNKEAGFYTMNDYIESLR